MAYVAIPAASSSSGGGGGGGTAFITAAQARAKALSGGALDPALTTYAEFFDDFTTNQNYTATNATKSLANSLDGGVLQVSITSNSGWVQITGTPCWISNPKTKKIYRAWNVRFDGPFTGTGATRVGLVSAARDRWTLMGLATTVPTTGATTFEVEVYDGTTNTLTGTSLAAETALFHLVEFYSDGTTGTYYVDGVALSVTVNMQNLGTSAMGDGINIYDNSATARTISIDKSYASFLAQ